MHADPPGAGRLRARRDRPGRPRQGQPTPGVVSWLPGGTRRPGRAACPAARGTRRHRPAAVRGAPARSLRPARGWADRAGGCLWPPAPVEPGGSRRGSRGRRGRGVGGAGAARCRAAPGWWAAAAGGFNAATRARAEVRYTPQPCGTELEASDSGIPPGTRCQIWATTASGTRRPTAAGRSPAATRTRGTPPPWRFRQAAWTASTSPLAARSWWPSRYAPARPMLRPRPLPSRNLPKAHLAARQQARVT